MLHLVLASTLASAGFPPSHLEVARYVRSGSAGHDGIDAALGIVVHDDMTVVAVGYLDGDEAHGTDAFAVHLAGSSVRWQQQWDSGPTGTDHLDSDDRLEAVAIGPGGVLALCGRLGGSGLDGAPEGYHWLEVGDPGDAQAGTWSWLEQDRADSPDQSCWSVAWSGTDIITAGSSAHVASDGRWWIHRLPGLVGKPEDPQILTWADHEAGADERPHDVAVNPFTGAFVVVGETRRSGVPASLVVAYDASGDVQWKGTYPSDVESRIATSATYDLAGDVHVGFQVTRSPWLYGQHSRFDPAGDGNGSARELWQTSPSVTHGPYLRAHDDGVTSVSTTTWQSQSRLSAVTYAPFGVSEYFSADFDTPDLTIHDADARGDIIAVAGSLPGADGTPDFAVLVYEADSDLDGVVNSQDECPLDPSKTLAGICGCGLLDTGDDDGDGVLDCVDRCADDPGKWADPGVCGCGVPDLDRDGDGWLDCEEICTLDPDKRNRGLCGCGVPDDDTDRDGIVDCRDDCPELPDDLRVDETCEVPEPGCGCTTNHTGWWAFLAPLGLLAARRRSSR